MIVIWIAKLPYSNSLVKFQAYVGEYKPKEREYRGDTTGKEHDELTKFPQYSTTLQDSYLIKLLLNINFRTRTYITRLSVTIHSLLVQRNPTTNNNPLLSNSPKMYFVSNFMLKKLFWKIIHF